MFFGAIEKTKIIRFVGSPKRTDIQKKATTKKKYLQPWPVNILFIFGIFLSDIFIKVFKN